MWVDTKGEDGPQCIHHTPVGALMAQPPPGRSCRSLQYALQNIMGSTLIKITCGTHKLQPGYYYGPHDGFYSFSNGSFVLWIVGECATNRPTVQFLNRTTATFSDFSKLTIREVVFKGYNKDEDYVHPKPAHKHNPTLYIYRCTNVTLQNVTVHVAGLYGIGLAMDTIIAHGVITLYNVSVLHEGTYGVGIICNIYGSYLSPVLNFSLYMNNVQVVNTNTHTKYDPSMQFSGIQVNARGTGIGTKISLYNVTVFNSAPVAGYGIVVRLSGDMHNSTVNLTKVKVTDGWDKRYQTKNETEVLAECASRQLDMINKTDNTARNVYSSISVLVLSSHNNTIYVTNIYVLASYGPLNVTALDFTFAGLATLNKVYIKFAILTAIGNPINNRYGLVVLFSDRTSQNTVEALILHVSNLSTVSGAGILLSFIGKCSRNSVVLNVSRIDSIYSVEGRILVANIGDYAENNNITFHMLQVINNAALQCGGIQIQFTGFARKNSIVSIFSAIAHNFAIVGGGMCIQFANFSERNAVFLLGNYILNNTALSVSNISVMGGGIHLEFIGNKAMFATKNMVVVNSTIFLHNKARGGVGGGLSVLYLHSPYTGDRGDKLHINSSQFLNNYADYGHAFAMQSSPQYRKALFQGISLTNTSCFLIKSRRYDYDLDEMYKSLLTPIAEFPDNHSAEEDLATRDLLSKVEAIIMNATTKFMKKLVNPFFQMQIETNTSLAFLASVQIRLHGIFLCGAASQGILAVDSEIILHQDSMTSFGYCVASHGGAIALYGDSYIRVSNKSTLHFTNNYAFQRGGALYVHSTTHAVPRVRCFLQYEHGTAEGKSVIVFEHNSAMHEGQSIYISDAENCFGSKIQLSFYVFHYPQSTSLIYPLINQTQVKFIWQGAVITNITFSGFKRTIDSPFHSEKLCVVDFLDNSNSFCNSTNTMSIDTPPQIVSRPYQVDNGAVDSDNPLTITFIPGKQRKLPFKHAYDKLGNVINTVFTVQVITQEPAANVQLNPFSKYTADFNVILHGIPLKHGMVSHISTTNEQHAAGNEPPRLALQSVDNSNLLLIMNIELQCCPPGYVYRIGSGDMGTCHCGISMVTGIEECNETDPNNIGAVLQGDYWAGYLPFNDQHSCNGQKFFSAPCPPGYCQTQLSTLPTNNSMKQLENAICGKLNRKGLLCGDCLERNGIAINFNEMRPVCASCQGGLSTVGLLVWILSEWVPMLVVMFIVMLFNIDLVSGRFNSFLLFAQLLAFSSVRGDAELGTVHIAFVKIYRFLYGMWNLDFFGVLLPPYCLIPHSHLTLLQTLLLHYSIGLFPLIVAITLIVLERSAEKWICCHRVDQCLRRMRRWKAKYSDGMSYDRALPAFVILGFTRFLVSSSYILVNQTITGEDGEERMVVWWQGSVPYGSIQHIAYFIPAIIILLVFVLLPAFLLLTLPIVPQLFGRLIIAVPPLRKLQRMQTFCSNVYTDRWIYHFVNVFQGCYKEHLRSFSSLYLFYRIIQLLASVFIPSSEDALRIQLILTLILLLLVVVFQPYTIAQLNNLDTAILGNMSLILVLSLQVSSANSQIGTKLFFAFVRMILIYLPLLYPGILFGRKVYMKCPKLRCCHRKRENEEDNEEPLIIDPTEGLGNFVRITELRAGAPTSSDEESETETQSEETILENQNTDAVVVDLAV